MRSGKNDRWWTSEAGVCLILFSIALLLRLGTVAYVNRFHHNFLFSEDSGVYDAIAQSVLSGAGFAMEGSHREATRIAPVFPIYLAILYGVFGRGLMIVGVANAFVGSLTCIVIYWIGRRLFNRQTATIGALLATAYWEFLFWTPFVLKETLALFLFIGALLLVLEATARTNAKLAFVAGGALGVASLARFPHVVFLPFLAGAFLASSDRKRLRRLIMPLALGALLASVPWLVRNYVVFGEVMLTNRGAAWALYAAHGPGKVADTRGFAGLEGLDVVRMDSIDQDLITPISAREREYRRDVLAEIANDPWRAGRLVAAKMLNMWRPLWEKFQYLARIPFTLQYAAVLTLGVVGLVRHVRTTRGLSLLHVVLLYYLAAHTLWWAEIRNRVYLMPYIVLFAAYVFDDVAARWSWARRTSPEGKQ